MGINKLENISFLNTLYYRIKLKINCVIYKKMKIYISKKSKINCKDRFLIGNSYMHCNVSNGTFLLKKDATLNIEGRFAIGTGSQISVEEDATLSIGSGYINRDSKINCFKNIKIGNNVVISEEVIIRDSDNHRVIENGEEKENTKNIVIGDNVWIGLRSIILKGANIGNGCIVAAGSVVNGKFPDNCLIAGVPAGVIKENISWEE